IQFGSQDCGAVLDRSRKYRYLLWRQFARSGPTVCFIMLNPSTADHEQNDPTVSRCISFSKQWGFARMEVVNLFSYRVTDSRRLYEVKNIVGADNDKYILQSSQRANVTVVAWGNHGELDDRDQEVLDLLAVDDLQCFGLTKSGHPRHPLYLSASTQL